MASVERAYSAVFVQRRAIFVEVVEFQFRISQAMTFGGSGLLIARIEKDGVRVRIFFLQKTVLITKKLLLGGLSSIYFLC